jgi:hypothetical protein
MEQEKKIRRSFDAVILAITSGAVLGRSIYQSFSRQDIEEAKPAVLAGILAALGYAKAKAAQREVPDSSSENSEPNKL